MSSRAWIESSLTWRRVTPAATLTAVVLAGLSAAQPLPVEREERRPESRMEVPDEAPDARQLPGAAIVLPTEKGQPVAPNTTPGLSYYLFVAGSSFHADSTTSGAYATTFGCVSHTSPAAVFWSYPLRLPDNATIRYVRNYYNRTSTHAQWVSLERVVPGTSSTRLLQLWANGTSGVGNEVSAQQSITVDNYNYPYELRAMVQNVTDGLTNEFCGVRIAYELPAEGTYNPITPCRVLDTRGISPPSPPYGAPSLSWAVTRSFQVSGRCGVPAGATAVAGNVTVTNTGGAGFVSVWTQGLAWPGNSTVNFSGAGQTVANAALMPLSDTGQISVLSSGQGTTDLVIDVTGWYY